MKPARPTDGLSLSQETSFSRRTWLQLAATLAGWGSSSVPLRAKVQKANQGIPFEEYNAYDGMGLAELIRDRQVSPLELLETAIARSDAVNPTINAISATQYDAARDAIEQGLPPGPFHGVPFLVKDLSFAIQGVASSFGSKLFDGRKARHDSTAVSRYRQAGLVLMGQTKVPELGVLPTTESTFGGITRNPFNLERTAGGSSGGSASAVAAGITAMASASDGGGSIRIPASCCGLFGLKPTRARIPLGPEVFEAWGGLAVLHALTRSVRDSAALLDATAGAEPGDSYHAPHHSGSFLEHVKQDPGTLRIALIRTMPPTQFVAPECLQALQKTVQLCESLGHQIEEVTDTFNRQFTFPELRQAHGITVLVALRRRIEQRLRELGRDLREDDLEPVTREYFNYAERYTAIQMEEARTLFFRAARTMAKFQKDYDVLLTPTLATPPIEHETITMTGTSNEVLEGILQFMPCTQIANWTGQPAMSVPLHETPTGLPIGVQFLGRFGDEQTLLRLAGQLEQACPWGHRRAQINTLS